METRYSFPIGLLVRISISALVAAVFISCGPSQPRLTGVAYEYDSAKDMLMKGKFDKAIEFSEAPATASPPNAFTSRAQVFQVVVYSGLIHGYRELADAYRKGADTTKTPKFKAAYELQRNDALQYGSRLALNFAELAHAMNATQGLEKEYTLDAPYPSSEAPMTLPQLARVMDGGWIDPEEQEAAGKDALLKGIIDALADIVGGDRSKARAELAAGPVKLDGADFGLYMGKELLFAARMFDKNHRRDSTKLKLICGEASQTGDFVAALLKEKPDKDRAKALKKLQDDIKSAVRKL